jgi:squalene-associated FAD-dependent desaturase
MVMPTDVQSAPRIVVVGGGLAGMAAGVALHSRGLHVTLVETRKTLGGRAGSYEDPQTGEELDNCQHVLLGCCTNLMDFFARVGAADQIHWERRVRFRDERGRAHDLWGIPKVPAPLNLGPSLLRFGALSVAQRGAVIRAMTAMLRLGRLGARGLADVPFGEWLDRHGQDAELVRRFYDPIIVSALNEETRRASARYAIQVFQEAMLANEAGYVVGVPACSLAQLYQRLPVSDLRRGERVTELALSDDRVAGVVLSTGEHLAADAVVLATNYHAARRLVPQEYQSRDERFAHLDKLQSVPILGAHLWFDRPVMRDPHAALISGPLQWLFRKDREGKVVHGVISAARQWVDRPREEMLATFERQVRSLFPAARDARLVRGAIVVEKRATFSPTPGSDRFRPGQAPPAGGVSNLYLAGDYTRTDWPATMEGAVRSGYLAADAIMRGVAASRPHGTFVAADLPTQWPGRIAGLTR